MTIGTYRVESTIAVGETSTVYAAAGGHGRVALKVLHPHLANDPVVGERFLAYAQSLATIRDPGLVRIYDFLDESNEHGAVRALAMELVEGTTLRNSDLDRNDVEVILRHLLETLSVIHAAGIVHRDIRPEHILIDDSGRPRLIDFTGASVRDLAGLSRSTIHTTRREYADPMTWGLGAAGPAQDLYSLGAVVYERLFGHPPVKRGEMEGQTRMLSNRQRAGGASSYLEALVQAMVGAPHERPRSAAEALDWLAAGQDVLYRGVTECLFCGALMPVEAVLCLECRREPPVIQRDPSGEYLVLNKISEEQSVLGPFLRTLRLLSVDPVVDIQLLVGDARLYSREERRRGYTLPVRIADNIAAASMDDLIAAVTYADSSRIKVTRYPMSRLRKVKRGPLITLRYRDGAAPASVATIRRMAEVRRRAPSDDSERDATKTMSLHDQFLHAVGIASARLSDVRPDTFDSVVSRFEALITRYERIRRVVETADLHAAYADIERANLGTERQKPRVSTQVFRDFADASQRMASLESTISSVIVGLESLSPQSPEKDLSNIVRQLQAATDPLTSEE